MEKIFYYIYDEVFAAKTYQTKGERFGEYQIKNPPHTDQALLFTKVRIPAVAMIASVLSRSNAIKVNIQIIRIL